MTEQCFAEKNREEREEEMGGAYHRCLFSGEREANSRQAAGAFIEWNRNHRHGAVRAQVQHVFGFLKCRFGYYRGRGRSLEKRGAQVSLLC